MTEPAAADQTDIGTEFVRQADHPNEAGLTAFEADLASKTGSKGDSKAAALQLDRAALSAKLWEIAEHHIIAEWICCEPLEPRHDLCAKGYAALGMAKTLLVDSPEAWNPNAPLLDAVLAMLPATAEEHRLALSDALGLGTGAPWDAIHDRATELGLPPLDRDPVARRLGLVAAPADRATVLNEAADHLGRQADELWAPGTKAHTVMHADAEELRRMAAESAPATGHDDARCPEREPLIEARCSKKNGHDGPHSDRPGRIWYPVDDEPEADPQPVSDAFVQQLATVKVREDSEQTTDRLRCPYCREDITDYAEDDHVFRTGDDRPYCSGECVIAAHRAGLPTAAEQAAAAQQPICKCPAEICQCGHHKAQQPKEARP